MKIFKGFIVGAVVMFLMMTMITIVLAEPINRTITAIFRDIKITIDGERLDPSTITDVNGKIVEPFIVDGTTYIPIRAFAEAVGYEVDWDGDTNTVMLIKKQTPSANVFHSATFTFEGTEYDSRTVKITGITVFFQGTHDYINLDDFTNIVLTRNGVPIDYKLTDVLYKVVWPEAMLTYFTLSFENDYTESGVYGLIGNYKCMSFEIFPIVIEAEPYGDESANSDDLVSVIFSRWATDETRTAIGGTGGIHFTFMGIQDSFCISDLTNVKLTLNGQEIEFSLRDYVIRSTNFDGLFINTSFTVWFIEDFTMHGTYQVTGNYREKPFESTINIP